ncbi:MAG: ATP-binding protein [Candidatus Omnitrophica bacterium]|nr:ATP-binding protein [Candidatus Omnitrophota bacterium]
MNIGRLLDNEKEKPKARVSLRRKITALICLSILIVLLIGSAIEYFWIISAMSKTAKENQLKTAETVSAFIADLIDEQVEQVRVFTTRILIKKVVGESNLKYSQMSREAIGRYLANMDVEWINAPVDSPLVKEYADNETSRKQLMPEMKENNDEVVELFITDKFGGLVASSRKTSDFYQADERWWQVAFEGNVFIGDVELDESSNMLGVTIATPIMDDEHRVIGVCKTIFDAQKLFSSLNKFKLGLTGHASIINDKGMIVFHEGVKPLSIKALSDDVLSRILSKNSSFEILNKNILHHANMFTTFKRVEHPILAKNNIVWFVTIAQEVKEVFAPLNDLATAMLIFFGAAILTMIPIGFIFGRSIVRPITGIVEGALEIGRGNLDYRIHVKTNDEVEDVAEALNSMTMSLKSKTTSIKLLNQEIDNRKKAEEAIVAAAKEWQKTFDSITDMVFIQDKDFTIIKANKAFADAMKMKVGDIIGKKCYQVVHKDNVPWPNCPFKKTKEDMQAHTEEVDDPHVGIPLLITTSPIFDKNGNLTGSVHIAKDISGMRKAREELERKNEELRKLDQLKSDFISTVSHELRTPLSIVKEGISLVLDKIAGEVNEKQDHILTTAKDNIDRLARVIDSLLDISKIEAGKASLNKTKFNIKDLVVKTAHSFVLKAREKELEIKAIVPDKDIYVYADADRITQVFVNLIGNAIKFTSEGSVNVSLEDKGKMVECSVADTGIGILAENLPKVFERFQQFGRLAGPGEKGTGLGLAISKNIIELHKGQIFVESKSDKGSKFTFILPKE